MKNQKIVLVPTDFSDVCLNAIVYGAEVAKYLGYAVTILHVIDRKTQKDLLKENLSESEIDNRLEGIAKKTKKKYGIDAFTLSRKGNIFSTISEVAKEIDAKIIVLGTHGKVGLQQKIGGSYAKKVVTSSPVPVIVVHKGTRFGKGFKNIVFPVSTTAEVRQKVAWAELIANAFKSKIHLFQLYESPEESQSKMRIILGQITKEFDKKKIAYSYTMALKGINFGDQVLDLTRKTNSDIITIMTSPSSMNFVFNRYTEKMILNQFEIPVMCVNPVDTWEEIWKF